MATQSAKCFAVACLVVLLFVLVSCSEDAATPDTIPPRVSISYPAAGTIVSDEVLISAYAEDNEDISKLQFFIDDALIAEDMEEPYDQIWYSGFWEGGVEYSIRAIAHDINGNQKESDPIVVTLQENSKYQPVITTPEEDQEFPTYTIDYSWNPVAGARGYILRIRIPGYELDYGICDDGTDDACFVWLTDTCCSKRLPFTICCYRGITIDVFISVKAYWTSYDQSDWSEERRIVYYAEPLDSSL